MIQRRGNEKATRHGEYCKVQGRVFIPAPGSTLGGTGTSEYWRLINRISHIHARRYTRPDRGRGRIRGPGVEAAHACVAARHHHSVYSPTRYRAVGCAFPHKHDARKPTRSTDCRHRLLYPHAPSPHRRACALIVVDGSNQTRIQGG